MISFISPRKNTEDYFVFRLNWLKTLGKNDSLGALNIIFFSWDKNVLEFFNEIILNLKHKFIKLKGF